MSARQPNVERLADLEDRTVVTVEDVARLLGISRSAAYEAAQRGEFPVRRVGRRLLVPVPALKRWLGDEPSPVAGVAHPSKEVAAGGGLTPN